MIIKLLRMSGGRISICVSRLQNFIIIFAIKFSPCRGGDRHCAKRQDVSSGSTKIFKFTLELM